MHHFRIVRVTKSFANFYVKKVIAPRNAGHLHHGMQVSIRYKGLLFLSKKELFSAINIC